MSAAGETVASALDRQELIERMMGNVQIAQRMLQQFIDKCDTEADLLETTVRLANPDEIASLAHRHKGTAKTLAAPRVATLATEIEQQAREGSVSDLLETVEQLREAHRELKLAVSDWATESMGAESSQGGAST